MAFSRDNAGGSGAVIGPTIYSGDGVIDSDRSISGFDILYSQTFFDGATILASTRSSGINASKDAATMAHTTVSGGLLTDNRSISLSTTSMLVTDTLGEKGLEYAANYSGNFNDRSIVDKGYVDAQSADTLYTNNGVINAVRTVEVADNNSLSFNAFDDPTRLTSVSEATFSISPLEADIAQQVLDGAGAVVTTSGISIHKTNGMTVTDETATTGLLYAADYSANFVNRSLVDKAYTDAEAAKHTIYSVDGEFSSSRDVKGFNQLSYSTMMFFGPDQVTPVRSSRLDMDGSGIAVGLTSYTGAAVLGETALILSNSGAILNDSTHETGIKYSADYSANFTARSLIDKAYVDSVPAVNIYTSDGVITGDRDVEGFNGIVYDFRIYDSASLASASTGGKVTMDGGGINFGYVNYSLGSMVSETAIVFNAGGGTIHDTALQMGLRYVADYSNNFVARSLVDKGYVDTSTVQSITGGTNVSVAGTATVPIVNLDNAITGTSVNGVTLNDGGSATSFLNETGAYSTPPDTNIYTTDGSMSEDRTVDVFGFAGSSLLIRSFDDTSIGAAAGASVVELDGDFLRLSYQDFSGGSPGDNQGLIFTSLNMQVIDGNNKGLENAADYSANFTARSLVDKAYVDGEVADIDTIYNTSGFLSSTREIIGLNARILTIDSYNAASTVLSVARGRLIVGNTLAHLTLDVMDTGSVTSSQNILITPSAFTVTDSTNQKGMLYAADYSANYTDRSIIDRGYSNQGILSRSSSASNLTSAGKPILALTDTSAARTVTIALSDIAEGKTFIIKDEDGNAAANNITIETAAVTILSVADAGGGSTDFNTATVHGYVVGQRVFHSGFTTNTSYNGLHVVTSIVDTDTYRVVLAFGSDEGGTSRTAIDGSGAFTISNNYGSMEVYCTNTGVFSRGGSATPSAGVLAIRGSTTGILEGGSMSIVGAPSQQLSIGATIGQITDHSDPVTPICTPVSISADPNYIIQATTDGVYLIAIDATSTIIEINEATRTTEDRHENVIIGAYIRSGGAAVRIIDEPVNVGYGITTAFSDFLHDLIGPANQGGNIISANGTNLSIDTSSGTIFVPGSNFMSDPDKPHQRTIPADTIITHRHSYSGSSGELLLEDSGADFTVIDPDQVNIPQGTLSATSNNQFTVQVVFLAPTGIYNVAYGQQEFGNLAAAKTAISDGTLVFDEIDAFLDQVKVAYIVVKQGTTDLTVVANAEIIAADKFRLMPPA